MIVVQKSMMCQYDSEQFTIVYNCTKIVYNYNTIVYNVQLDVQLDLVQCLKLYTIVV
jgi:hypothetical protein